MNAGNSVLSNWVDLPTYPVLYAEYVGGLFHLDFWGKLAIKATSLILVVILNILGMEAVSISSIVLVAIMLTPFFVQPFLQAPAVADWGGTAPTIDWAAWTGVMLVSMAMSPGCRSAESQSCFAVQLPRLGLTGHHRW